MFTMKIARCTYSIYGKVCRHLRFPRSSASSRGWQCEVRLGFPCLRFVGLGLRLAAVISWTHSLKKEAEVQSAARGIMHWWNLYTQSLIICARRHRGCGRWSLGDTLLGHSQFLAHPAVDAVRENSDAARKLRGTCEGPECSFAP